LHLDEFVHDVAEAFAKRVVVVKSLGRIAQLVDHVAKDVSSKLGLEEEGNHIFVIFTGALAREEAIDLGIDATQRMVIVEFVVHFFPFI
jgi:hypothetical protein